MCATRLFGRYNTHAFAGKLQALLTFAVHIHLRSHEVGALRNPHQELEREFTTSPRLSGSCQSDDPTNEPSQYKKLQLFDSDPENCFKPAPSKFSSA
jgi:hypothetical protein